MHTCFRRFKKDHFTDLVVDGIMVIEMAFEETGCEGVDRKRNSLCKLQQFIF
jgi:hypothetical protein